MSTYSNFHTYAMHIDNNGKSDSMGYQKTNNNGDVNEKFFIKNNFNNKKEILGKSDNQNDWKIKQSFNEKSRQIVKPYNEYSFDSFNNHSLNLNSICEMEGENPFPMKIEEANSNRESFNVQLPDNNYFIDVDQNINNFFKPLIDNSFQDPFF